MRHHAKEARALLERDHARIEELLTRAACSVREDSIEVAEARWNELEEALLGHLDAEELYVIPQLASANEEEADRLVKEHTRIRGDLGDLGIAFELHTLRAEMIDAFCARLREHAAHEEVLMYPLVESGLSSSRVGRLLAKLGARRSARGGASVENREVTS